MRKCLKVWRAKVLGKGNGCKLNFTSCSKGFKDSMGSKGYHAYQAYQTYPSHPTYP
jgi:hypothetical protein